MCDCIGAGERLRQVTCTILVACRLEIVACMCAMQVTEKTNDGYVLQFEPPASDKDSHSLWDSTCEYRCDVFDFLMRESSVGSGTTAHIKINACMHASRTSILRIWFRIKLWPARQRHFGSDVNALAGEYTRSSAVVH